jgi:hypothetical protein
VAAELLHELGHSERRASTPTRSSPPSPCFSVKLGASPDYYPSTEADDSPSEHSRSRSRSRSPSLGYKLKEAQTDLLLVKAQSAQVSENLTNLRDRFGRLRSGDIYLEGELAVYKRFADIHSFEPKPTPFRFPPPPPPPPRRA